MGFLAADFKLHALMRFFAVAACFLQLQSTAQRLPQAEVETLKLIAAKLNYDKWSVNRDSCNGGGRLNVSLDSPHFSSVACDCTFNSSTVCHVTSIEMKRLDLNGVMPAEFGDLSYLQVIDLTLNYINGPIPASLSKAPLTSLSLLGNRLSGQIPKEIGDIATLEQIVLEGNQLVGPLPDNLGNLSNLKILILSSNNFTGKIPQTFGNLRNMIEFRIDGNGLSGKIPDFIGNWTSLTRLDMQGTSMEGPIPGSFSSLTNLSELRISDLRGPNMVFPDLKNLKNIKYLMLRNCLINGSIPEYIGGFSNLKRLDLSFNQLTGPITQKAVRPNLNYLFLTGNSLTGEPLPNRMNAKAKYDLSYNNFNGPQLSSCQNSDINLIYSYSPSANTSQVSWCFKKGLPCSTKPKYHSLFINCGGVKARYDGDEYEEDINLQGPTTFVLASEKWAYSSTGVYDNNDTAPYITSNRTPFNPREAEIYGSARLAPVSLKYYGLCLLKGSYTVRLHFSEIMFSNDNTSTSLGRRIFDISIQGKVVRKDFNIMEEAKRTSRSIVVLEYNDVLVNGTTLEIHLYWSGKGTNFIPFKGVYGPLISAISVKSNFKVHSGLSSGAIVGIVVASCVVVALILIVFRMNGYLGGEDQPNKELQELELQTGYYSLRQIKSATDNFSFVNKIGEGGFGPVYKGVLADGTAIAVKQLSSKSKQGNREFVNEIGMISALQHPNLARLYGCCIEGNQLLLVYEYMENNSLARALFGREEQCLKLDWPTRSKICLGIARGLTYLHEESRLKIVHRDIKATNVLLDKDLNAKISDFGLAKLDEEENTHISTRIAGTVGYMAPEYAMRGYLTDKADVYSFGVVVLEVVSGKSNMNYRPKEEFVYLLDWAYVLQEQGNLLELIDPCLESNYSSEEALRMMNVALLCTNPSPTLRPAMSSVVSMLDGQIAVQAPVVKHSTTMDESAKFRSLEVAALDSSQTLISASSQSRASADGGPWLDSSISLHSKDGPKYSSTSKLLPVNGGVQL